MLKKLVKIANKLDLIGMTKEADVIDRFIKKTASINLENDDLFEEGSYEHVPTIFFNKEPKIDREELKNKFLDHASKYYEDIIEDTAKLTWVPKSESEYSFPHYLLSFKYSYMPRGSYEKIFSEGEFQFWAVEEAGYPPEYLVSVQDEYGNDFYFYSEY